jgi:hypothetical protein
MHAADHGGCTLPVPDFPRRSRLRAPRRPAFLADLLGTARGARSRATRAATAASAQHRPEARGGHAT